MRMPRAVLDCLFGGLLTVAACSFTPGQPAGGDDDAPPPPVDARDPDAPTVDPDASPDGPVDGPVDAPIDGPACTARCDGTTAVTCAGDQEVRTTCELGCVATGTPRCAQLDPSNLADASDLDGVTGTIAFTTGAEHYLDTDTGEIFRITNNMRTVVRAAGGLVGGTRFRQVDGATAVLAVASFALPAGTTLTGVGSRGLILLAAGAVEIGGTLDWGPGLCYANGSFTQPSRRCGGPGGGSGVVGGAGGGCAGGPGGTNGGNENGGAGGGLGTAGGNGGAGSVTAVAAALTSCPGPTLEPLRGGSAGGSGAPSGNSYGGGAGGALQITSLTGIVLAGDPAEPALIDAPGAGGNSTLMPNRGGGGGGSGGAVLLEAPTVRLSNAEIITSGGGGGGGRVTSDSADGAYGNSAGPAAGGVGDGMGGAGGAGAFNASPAVAGGGNVDGTGGGGGGLGRVRINTRDGQYTSVGSAVIGASTLGTLTTR